MELLDFLKGKKYDESECWTNMTLGVDTDGLISTYRDGDVYPGFRIDDLLRTLNKYRSDANKELLSELQKNYPEILI